MVLHWTAHTVAGPRLTECGDPVEDVLRDGDDVIEMDAREFLREPRACRLCFEGVINLFLDMHMYLGVK